MRYTLAGLFLLLTMTVSAAHFPLCMYGVDNPTDLPLLKKAGFTCVQTYQREPEKLAPLAKAAKKQGLKIVFYPNKIIGSAYEKQAAAWPVLAWYLVDEPDVARWSRARVEEAREKARTAFPKHENALVIGQGRIKIPFYDLPDNLMMDWYPVPHLPLTSFGDNVRYAKEGQQRFGVATHNLWGVVQIFDWKEFKQYRPDNDRVGRFPTADEIRFMSYDGIVNGASGLFYFIFTTEGKPLPLAQPERWARVEKVSRELSKLRPVLEKGTIISNPVEVSAPLALQTRRYKNRLYIILLNRSDAPVSVPDDFLTPVYKTVFGEMRTSQISPYGVWVLKSKKI